MEGEGGGHVSSYFGSKKEEIKGKKRRDLDPPL